MRFDFQLRAPDASLAVLIRLRAWAVIREDVPTVDNKFQRVHKHENNSDAFGLNGRVWVFNMPQVSTCMSVDDWTSPEDFHVQQIIDICKIVFR